MTRLGFIPAGGQALRFGGIMKEMLPCDEHTLLDRCVSSMAYGGADTIVVISSPEKIGVHAHQLKGRHVTFIVGGGSLWTSLTYAMRMPADEYLFAMPDTYYPVDCFDHALKDDFTLGLFTTHTPSRFGVLHEDLIWDKYFDSGEYKAWGVLAWTKRVVDFWREYSFAYESHTHAFIMAMKEHGYSTFDLAYYYDMASFSDYRKLVMNV